MAKTPSQGELLPPLLEILHNHPKGLSAAEAVAAVADKLELTSEQEAARRGQLPNGAPIDLFARDVRWARQKAKAADLLDGRVRNL